MVAARGLSVYGGEATVGFEDGDIIERSPTGETSVWGTVTEWTPGSGLSFTWHPGKESDKVSAVRISFEDRGDGTLVVLEHRGWEMFAEPESARSEYDQGWPMVLDRYAEAAAAEAA